MCQYYSLWRQKWQAIFFRAGQLQKNKIKLPPFKIFPSPLYRWSLQGRHCWLFFSSPPVEEDRTGTGKRAKRIKNVAGEAARPLCTPQTLGLGFASCTPYSFTLQRLVKLWMLVMPTGPQSPAGWVQAGRWALPTLKRYHGRKICRISGISISPEHLRYCP